MYGVYILIGISLTVIFILGCSYVIMKKCEKNGSESIPTSSPQRRRRDGNINLPDPELLELNGDL
jgi:hypothetical protein